MKVWPSDFRRPIKPRFESKIVAPYSVVLVLFLMPHEYFQHPPGTLLRFKVSCL